MSRFLHVAGQVLEAIGPMANARADVKAGLGTTALSQSREARQNFRNPDSTTVSADCEVHQSEDVERIDVAVDVAIALGHILDARDTDYGDGNLPPN
jgi:hypothetical protein